MNTQAPMNADVLVFRRLFVLLRRNIWVILLSMFIAGGSAFLASKAQTPIYQAKTQMMVTRESSSSPVEDVTQRLNSLQLTETYVKLLSQKWLQDIVIERVDGDAPPVSVQVSAETNTQIIEIVVEDPSPQRAVAISDTLVEVMIEQNESIQSKRYAEAEESLDRQILDIEQKIAELQVLKEVTREDAVAEQLARAQENMLETQSNLLAIEAEIAKLQRVGSATKAQNQLSNALTTQQEYQTILDAQLADYAVKEAMLPVVMPEEPPQEVIDLQSGMAELGVAINQTRDEITALQVSIDWLTLMAEEGALERKLSEKGNELAVEQALLTSYQKIITDLASTHVPIQTTDDIVAAEENLKLYQNIYLNLLNNRETVRLERLQNVPNIVQLTPGLASKSAVRPRTMFNTLLGIIAGMVLAVAALFLVNFLDTTLKTRDDVEKALNIPIIGYTHRLDRAKTDLDGPYVLSEPRSPASEAFRSLRTNLEFISVDEPLKSILISSPGASEGKTTVAANLAAVVAQSGKRVLLLDADLRRPRVHKEMGLPNRVGLSDVFRDKVGLKDVIQPWDGLNLSVITSGGIPPNPAELLGSAKMGQILATLEEEFDLVIIDSTPTLVTDSQLIAARAGGVLLVIWPGRTDAENARTTAEQYRRVGARMLGAVLNNVEHEHGYGGYKQYAYYQQDKPAKRQRIKLPWSRKKAQNGNRENFF